MILSDWLKILAQLWEISLCKTNVNNSSDRISQSNSDWFMFCYIQDQTNFKEVRLVNSTHELKTTL